MCGAHDSKHASQQADVVDSMILYAKLYHLTLCGKGSAWNGFINNERCGTVGGITVVVKKNSG